MKSPTYPHLRKSLSRRLVLLFTILLAAVVFSAFSITQGFATVSVTMPDTSQAWSNTVSIPISVSKADSLTNIFDVLVDGVLYRSYGQSNSFALPLDTTKLFNGPHEIFVHVWGEGGNYPTYGRSGPYLFTTSNINVPVELRANYKDLYLVPEESQQLTFRLVYSDRSATQLPSNSISLQVDQSNVATISAGGLLRAQTVGAAKVTATANGFQTFITVNVAANKSTPHFGKDGSVLTSYEPTKSTFITSMFWLHHNAANQQPGLISDLRAANINTLEDGFYIPPDQTSNFEQWRLTEDQAILEIANTVSTNDLNVLLTGDNIARGSPALYDSLKGPGSAWTVHPVEYAFTAIKNIGRVIGVEMVDEISFSWPDPYPEGRLGQTDGPLSVSCVNDNCVADWKTAPVNGARRFLITGANDPNINRLPPNFYSVSNFDVTNGKLHFTAPGVGTKTFTPQSDPNLTFEMIAAVGLGPGGTDFLKNDSFNQLMAIINRVPGRACITWPVAGDHGPATVANWQGDPRFSDYATLYWSLDTRGKPSMWEQLMAFRNKVEPKLSVIQTHKPALMLGNGAGPFYKIGGQSRAVSRISDEVIVFAEPHGIDATTVVRSTDFKSTTPRIRITNSSNPALNGKYYVYEVIDQYRVKAFLAAPRFTNSQWQPGGTIKFSDNSEMPIYFVSPTLDLILSVQGSPWPNPTATDSAGSTGIYYGQLVTAPQFVTLSNSPNPSLNRRWLLLHISNGGFDLVDTSEGSGDGGQGIVITDNNYIDGRNPLLVAGSTPQMVSTSIAYAAEKGFAGVRIYNYAGDINRDYAANRSFDGEGQIQIGSNPRYNGPDSIARWQAISNISNLLKQIEPFLLESKLHSPDYGSMFTAAARTGPNGELLMVTNHSEAPVTETISLSEYNTGGPGVLYRATPASFTIGAFTGSSQTLTFAPGETVAWTFLPGPTFVPDTTPPEVQAFDAQPRNTTGPITVTWTVTDSGGSHLGEVEILRAEVSSSSCSDPGTSACSWAKVETITAASDIDLWSSSTGASTPEGSYWYGLDAIDNAGNRSRAPVYIRVDSVARDTIAPSVMLTFPNNEAVIRRDKSINLQASASDNKGVVRVRFYVDGSLKCTDIATPYSCVWRVPSTRNRTYKLLAKAYDAAGNVGASLPVKVTAR